MMLSYPSDEVGNNLISPDKLDESGVNPLFYKNIYRCSSKKGYWMEEVGGNKKYVTGSGKTTKFSKDAAQLHEMLCAWRQAAAMQSRQDHAGGI